MSSGEVGKVYSDGEIIFKEGEQGNCMYVIQSGKVRITKSDSAGERTIAVLENGELFGEMALFDKLPRSATARALGDARILSMDKKRLFAGISRDPTLAFKTLEAVSGRIRKLNDEIMKLKNEGSTQ